MMLYLPIFGKLVRKTTIARFTRTLGTLISAGVPILEAITITKRDLGQLRLREGPRQGARLDPRGRELRRPAP
jgi:type II secretory pathway component PulF